MKLPYAMLQDFARRFAGGLAKLGVKRGQHVALMLSHVSHFTIAYFGAYYAGAPVVPFNVLLTPDEMAYHFDDSDAVARVAWEAFTSRRAPDSRGPRRASTSSSRRRTAPTPPPPKAPTT